MLRVVEHMMSKNEDAEGTQILQEFYKGESNFVNEISKVFEQEGAALPVGFTENDVNMSAPQMFDDIFHIDYLRLMMKIASGLHALHLTMAYRKDMMELYKNFSTFAEEFLEKTTQYLLKKGALTKSPSVSLPNHTEFVRQKEYRSGSKLFGHKRSLTTVEVAYLYQAIESNVTGMKLMTGFGQGAKEKEVQEYFFRGKELSKKIISKLSDVLLDSDINPPSASSGHVTASTETPFSEKLMLYNTALLSSFSLGSNALGSSFSLRNDLPRHMAVFAKDILEFASDGGNILIKYGWMEEPPQMEDRTQLIKEKNRKM